MRAYLAFTKKEFTETTRSYKLLIMGCVFLLLGLMNPITAKITPQLMDSFLPEGMKIAIPEPTAADSWAQFFKNVPQMGLIVLVIVFSGIMANEFSRGTLVNMLTKGLSRSIVIVSKFTMAVSVWTASYVLCFVVSYAYTSYFWKENSLSTIHILFAVFCLWLFGVLLLASMMLGGVLFKNSYGCLLFTGGFVVILFLINIVPKLQDFNPIALASNNMTLITNSMPISDFVWPIVLCAALTAGFIIAAVALFNKKQV